MKGVYVVAGYQGRLSIRFVPDNSTTVYMDEELESFDTIEEANDYVDKHEENYWQQNNQQESFDYDVDYFACDCCGALHSNDCRCDDYDV